MAATTDPDTLHLSADPQLASPFFTLPAEIRNLIYTEFWHLGPSRQHIVLERVDDKVSSPRPPPRDAVPVERWAHTPCVADPARPDVRFDRFLVTSPVSAARDVWGKRLKSEWCLHWACEERCGPDVVAIARMRAQPPSTMWEEFPAPLPEDEHIEAPSRAPIPKSGFLDLLRVCKRMYLEALPSLYATTTFIFTDTRTAGDFLSLYTGTPALTLRHPIRSVELCLRIPNILTEIYYPPATANPSAGGGGGGDNGRGDDGPPAVFAGRARPGLSMSNNPWQRVCDALAALPQLQDLRVWLDSSDLRPWHKRVSETRFFGRLFDVRVAGGEAAGRFVLGVPELPERRGPDSQALEGQYLEGERLEGAPFVLERGPRPNNWRVHLRNIVGISAMAG
ncbi:hypothetical protein C8A05DRAFT_33263 [Staphylotrichum tortipilum]|uniref:DUF7730 domain-containing protein n=1 Tax=Staphylotrichum tortipilum TaxID=2831512 RepID=A0AAN6RUI5_9PEZI|nr:hypothetical protein C8A05DRAFT_33263 [Staphylotrichum longicolle]